MTLRFDLGPFEELHLGKCIIKNSHQKALFVLEGDIPIVRGKDFLKYLTHWGRGADDRRC